MHRPGAGQGTRPPFRRRVEFAFLQECGNLFLDESVILTAQIESHVLGAVGIEVGAQGVAFAVDPAAEPVKRRPAAALGPVVSAGAADEREAVAPAKASDDVLRGGVGGDHPPVGEDVAQRAAHEDRTRRAQQQIAEVVETEGQLSEVFLFGVGRKPALKRVVDGGEVASRRRRLHAVVEGHHEGCGRSAAGDAVNAQLLLVHVRTFLQVVERTHGVPHADPRKGPAQPVRERTAPVVPAPAHPVRRHHALALVDGIVHEREESRPRAGDAGVLVAGSRLAVVRVAAGDEQGRIRRVEARVGTRHVHVAAHPEVRLRREQHLLDADALVEKDRAGGAGLKRRARGQTTQRSEEGRAHRFLAGGQFLWRFDFPPRLVGRDVGLGERAHREQFAGAGEHGWKDGTRDGHLQRVARRCAPGAQQRARE